MASRAEIREQQKRVEMEAEERKRALAAALQQSVDDDVATLAANIEELAKEIGMHALTLVEQRLIPMLSGKTKRASTPKEAKAPKAAKYADPNNPSLTWVGTGQKPKWFAERLAQGWEAGDMLVEKVVGVPNNGVAAHA
jgi:DNA-binding protein H-NS